jgi:hypothetical protein
MKCKLVNRYYSHLKKYSGTEEVYPSVRYSFVKVQDVTTGEYIKLANNTIVSIVSQNERCVSFSLNGRILYADRTDVVLL